MVMNLMIPDSNIGLVLEISNLDCLENNSLLVELRIGGGEQ